MADERAFYFRCSKSVASHVQNVIDAANYPGVAVFIAAGAVAGEIIAFELAPVLMSIARFVPVDRAQHGRPGPPNNQFSSDIWPNLAPLLIDNGGIDPKERECCAAWFCWNGAGQGRNHDRASFGLPPRIDDRTTPAADRPMIPHPGFGINRLAYRAQQTKR